jgi:type IV secretory pathway protease TraF
MNDQKASGIEQRPPVVSPEIVKKVLVLAALVVVIWVAMSRIIVAKGESVPYTVFWVSPNAVAKLSDFVTLSVSHPVIGDEPVMLTKQIVCDEGQRIERTADAFICDGQRLGGFITRTWDDKALEPFEANVVIPPGQAFVMGTHPRSFDSRYFGLVDKATLVVVRPLI